MSKPSRTAPPASQGDTVDGLGLERLVFFSDAVFAIAITLLALDLRLPEGGLETDAAVRAALRTMSTPLITFVISFTVVGVFWVGHHRRYRYVGQYDARLLWLNLLLLMLIAFVPFPTSVLSASGQRTATVFYAATMATIGVATLLNWLYASHRRRLLRPEVTDAQVRRETRLLLAAPVVFLLSIGLAWVNDDVAKFSWLLLLPITLLLREHH
jgi:uncharacterized membrane protein